MDRQGASGLQQNHYDPSTGPLTLTDDEAGSFQSQIARWTDCPAMPTQNTGLQPGLISDPRELRSLTALFAWTA